MDDEPFILPSASRHGVSEADMLHALRYEHHHFTQDDGMTMVIGPDWNGVPIEVGIVAKYGVLAVAHALRPARARFLIGEGVW